jgi:integrase
LACTGIRPGEAVALDRGDVDTRHGLLRIVNSKFNKSREVALHPATVDALGAYARTRDQHLPRPACPAFLLSSTGTRLLLVSVRRTFGRLVDTAGLAHAPGRRPRLHDFRHTFAVRTLLSWHTSAADVQARLPQLSTYLGHLSPATTYYYLSAAPELLALAAGRLEPPAPR